MSKLSPDGKLHFSQHPLLHFSTGSFQLILFSSFDFRSKTTGLRGPMTNLLNPFPKKMSNLGFWFQYWGSLMGSMMGSILGFNIGFNIESNIGFQYWVEYWVEYCAQYSVEYWFEYLVEYRVQYWV